MHGESPNVATINSPISRARMPSKLLFENYLDYILVFALHPIAGNTLPVVSLLIKCIFNVLLDSWFSERKGMEIWFQFC